MTLQVLLLCINWQTQLQKRQKDQEHTGNGIELVRQADNAECSWVVQLKEDYTVNMASDLPMTFVN